MPWLKRAKCCMGATSIPQDILQSHALPAIDEVFVWRGKKMILRGAILGKGIHFTAMLRMPNGWMHFDDMSNPKFTFWAKEDGNKAMGHQQIVFLAFEVVPGTTEKEFGRLSVTGSNFVLESRQEVFKAKQTRKAKKARSSQLAKQKQESQVLLH